MADKEKEIGKQKEINYEELEEMGSSDIDNMRVELEKKLKTAEHHYHLIEQEKLKLQRRIIDRQAEKKDLEIRMSKGWDIIKGLRSDIKILGSVFWKVRNQESGR